LVYIAYLIVGYTIGAIAYLGVTDILFPVVAYGVMVAVALLVSIPWYYYAGAVALLVVPAYSFLWCVARDLTEEDWKSNSANNFAVFVVATFIAFVVSAFVFVVPVFLAFVVSAFVFVVATFIAIAAIESVDKITVVYYVFRFFGAAWNHYIHGG
jgi:hypothetical protein